MEDSGITILLSGDTAKAVCLEMLEHGASHDDLLIFCKSVRFPPGLARFVLESATDLSDIECKKLVHESLVWQHK